MLKWILERVLFAAVVCAGLALASMDGLGQGAPPSVPPPPPPPGSYSPQVAVYRVYYYHTLRPRRIFLYATYTNPQHAGQAVNWLNAHPRFKAYIG